MLIPGQGWHAFKMASGDLLAESPESSILRFDVLSRGAIKSKVRSGELELYGRVWGTKMLWSKDVT